MLTQTGVSVILFAVKFFGGIAMSATIIKIPRSRQSRVLCTEAGVIFPQLFRLTGYTFKLKEGCELVDGLIASDNDFEPNLADPAIPSYTLDAETHYGQIAYPTWEPIQHLDAKIDTGVVYIRRHANRFFMEAYIDAMCDTENYDIVDRWHGYDSDLGCFTLLHRRANKGAQDAVVVYTTKIKDPFGDGVMDWYRIIGPNGEILTPYDLEPPDVQEQYAPVREKLQEE